MSQSSYVESNEDIKVKCEDMSNTSLCRSLITTNSSYVSCEDSTFSDCQLTASTDLSESQLTASTDPSESQNTESCIFVIINGRFYKVYYATCKICKEFSDHVRKNEHI